MPLSKGSFYCAYSMISVMEPAPTVRPPSRMEKPKSFFHRDGVDQLDAHLNVIARHAHFHSLGKRDDTRNVGGSEIELRTIVGQERSVTSALFLLQNVNLTLDLVVRCNGTGLRQNLPSLDLRSLNTAEKRTDVIAGSGPHPTACGTFRYLSQHTSWTRCEDQPAAPDRIHAEPHAQHGLSQRYRDR